MRLVKPDSFDRCAELHDEPPVYSAEQRRESRYALWVGYLAGWASAGLAWAIFHLMRWILSV